MQQLKSDIIISMGEGESKIPKSSFNQKDAESLKHLFSVLRGTNQTVSREAFEASFCYRE